MSAPTWSVAAPPQVSSWLDGQRPTFARRLALAAASASRTDAGALLAAANAPGMRGKLTYAFRLVFPSRDYLRWRYGAGGQQGAARLYALLGGALRGR